jgi:ankyrin repeat protein
VVALLCELGANVNAKDRWGGEPLMDAINGRHEAVAEELQKNGAIVTINRPERLLHEAISRGDLVHVALMLTHGIPIDACNYDDRTGIRECCCCHVCVCVCCL